MLARVPPTTCGNTCIKRDVTGESKNPATLSVPPAGNNHQHRLNCSHNRSTPRRETAERFRRRSAAGTAVPLGIKENAVAAKRDAHQDHL